MTPIAVAVKYLLAAGADHETIVAAVCEMEAAGPKDEAAERRRAWDRERKKRNSTRSTGIPPASTGIPPENAEFPRARGEDNPLTLVPSGKKEEAKASSHSRGNRTRRCPETWLPGPRVLALSDAEGFQAGELERELAKMRNHEFASPRSDWDGVACNWLMRAAENKSKANGHDRPNAALEKLQRVDAAMRRAAGTA
jgi:hypothetical protein